MPNKINKYQQLLQDISTEIESFISITKDDFFAKNIPALTEQREDEEIKKILMRKIKEIESTIVSIVHEIKQCDQLQQAFEFFYLLREYEACLEQLTFKYNVTLPPFLNKFMHYFMRVHDPRMFQFYFDNIKNENYCLFDNEP